MIKKDWTLPAQHPGEEGREGYKKAPPPPAESLSPPHCSPSHARLSGDNFQPEKPPGHHRKTNSVDSVETPSQSPHPGTSSLPCPANLRGSPGRVIVSPAVSLRRVVPSRSQIRNIRHSFHSSYLKATAQPNLTFP